MTIRHGSPALLLFVGLACFSPTSLIAQPAGPTCTAMASVPSIARAEGLSELVGDYIVQCTGGSAGTTYNLNWQVYLNTAITSQLLPGSATLTEALLIVDELVPTSGVPCLDSDTTSPCGAGMTNTYRGTKAAENSISWTNIPFVAPGAGTRVFRFTNIRVNASQVSPGPISMLVSASGPASLPLSNPVQTVAFVQAGLSLDVRNCNNTGSPDASLTAMHQCSSVNATQSGDPTAAVDLSSAGRLPGSQFTIRFREGFANAFKPQAALGQTASVPGTIYSSESGFANTARLGLYTGMATSGTRLIVRFANIPAGVKLQVGTGNTWGTSSATVALVSTDASGASPTGLSVVPASSTGNKCSLDTTRSFAAADIPVYPDGSAMAVWEVMASNPNAMETVAIPVIVSYTSNPVLNLPALGASTLSGTLAPLSTVAVASNSAPVPRFADGAAVASAFSVVACSSQRYALQTSVIPVGAGTITANPSSTDGKYDSGTAVQLTATANADYAFSNWTGDAPSGMNPVTLTMNSAKSATANFSCLYGLSAGAASFDTAGGNLGVPVTTGASCPWFASSPVNWITVILGASGMGSGSAVLHIEQNSSGQPRSATVLVGGQPLTVAQAGLGCSTSVAPGNAFLPSAAGSGSALVTATASDCPWTASSGSSWLTASGGGNGSGTLNYNVTANTSTSSRTATISVGGQTITVVQAGNAPCTYSLSQASQAFGSAVGAGSLTIAAPGGCAWTAVSAVPWITVTSGATGTGTSAVRFAVDQNPFAGARTGGLTIGGQTFAIFQSGATSAVSCTASSTPNVVAAEGRTEPVSDIVLHCSGINVPLNADVSLTLNTNVTNTSTAGITDARLLVNESDPISAQLLGYNVLVWRGVTLPAGTATLRVSNVRADASRLTGTDSSITGQLTVNANVPVLTGNSLLTLGSVRQFLTFNRGVSAAASRTFLPVMYQEAVANAFQASTPDRPATRLRLRLTGIPANALVYAPVYPLEGSNRAQLLSADSNGNGGGTIPGVPMAGGFYQPLSPVGGAATATWQVLSGDPLKLELLTFSVLIDGASAEDLSQITVSGSFAPVSDIGVASATAPVPRYLDASASQHLVYLRMSVGMAASPAPKVPGVLPREPVIAGTNVTFVYEVTNDTADETAPNVQVRSYLPSGLTLVSCTRDDGGSCAGGGGMVQLDYGALAPGEKRRATVVASVAAGTPSGALIENSASASSSLSAADVGAATAAVSFVVFNGTLLATNPPGLNLVVDGVSQAITWQGFQWTPGSAHAVSVPTPQPGGTGMKYVFTNWSDGGAQNPRAITADTNGSYTANFAIRYLLTLTTSAQGSVTPSPASADLFFDTGTSVQLTASPAPGCTFTSWGGHLTGSANPATVIMNGAKTVTAAFDCGGAAANALRFVPVAPCRAADTRLGSGAVQGGMSHDFALRSVCGVPSNAQAYSLNVTVVPAGPLGYLTMWPAGQAMPTVSTLNSLDGRIRANAAIVPAGSSGAISVFASAITDVILDINGYFVPATEPTALAFYPVTPCRVFDTRVGTGPLGGPSVEGGKSRDFLIPGVCGIPATAKAYSFNFTAVPPGPLGYLTVWPAGSTMPTVSTLNAPTGLITPNAAIVPAGTNGAISVFASASTDVLADVNGYFAPPGSGGLSLYAVTPCRAGDTRLTQSSPVTGVKDFAISASSCGLPATAKAYSFNVTAVPPGPLGYLTIWPAGSTMPVASALNALDGSITANAAIVPAANGSVSVFVSAPSHVVLDANGYFAP